ncbi:hypothetical protein JHK84_043161 [Glycine max]|nr:hypothetical protein JHK84_043161 [Glycine max]
MTVWEEYALQLDDAIEKNHFVQKPLVIMLTLTKIKDSKDKYPLSVQNIKHGSKLYVNTDIVEIQQFRKSLRVPFYVGGVTNEGSASQSQYSQHSQRNSVEKFLHNAQMVNLGEISRLRQSGDEIKVFPPCVDELLGKTWAVIFKYHFQMRQSSMLDDEPSIGKSPAVGAETSSQDYHLTSADYDPGKTVFVTPAKRMCDQQDNSEFEFDEYTPYELLTNKHMKVE